LKIPRIELCIALMFVLLVIGCTKTSPPDTPSEKPSSNIRLSDSELFTQAVDKNDPSKCRDMENTQTKLSCFDTLKKVKAIEERSPEICQSISNIKIRDDCIKLVDNEIQRFQQRNLNEITSTTECNIIQDAIERENCISLRSSIQALESQDFSICDQMTDPVLRDNCKDSILKTQAIEGLNEQLCMSITSERKKETCISDVLQNKARK